MIAGFDYGTSHCALGVLHGSSIRLVPLQDDQTQLPSTLYAPDPSRLSVTGADFAELSFGSAALAEYLREPTEGYFVKSPKSFLGARGLPPLVLRRFVLVVAAMMRHVRDQATDHLGVAPTDVVIGRPINFQQLHAEDANRQAQEMLVEAARMAGFGQVEFLFEPMAAALDFEASLTSECCALVVDIGGGTTDCSFVRVGPGRSAAEDRAGDVLGHSGERLGGNDYDQHLALAALMPAFGYGDLLGNGRPLPNRLFVDAVSTNDVNAQQRFYSERTGEALQRHLLDAREPGRLRRLQRVYAGRQSYQVLRQAEQAKIALSAADHCQVELDFVEPEFAVAAELDALRQGCQRLLNHLQGLVEDVLAQGGRAPDVLYLTGGMAGSRIVRDHLDQILPGVPVVDGDHFGSVTQGLTRHAQRVFGR